MSRIRDIASILTTASNLATDTETAAAITAHNSATTSVHGITNTADLATKTYVQLNKGVQSGTSVERPTSFLSSNGDVYSNTTTGYLEVYSSTYGWEKVGANPSNLTVTPTNLGAARAYNDGGVELDLGFPSIPGRSYVITSSPSSGTTTVTTPYAIITGLQSSTQYTFTATATNLYGSSTPTTSSPITVTTVPQAPTIGSATAVGSTTAYVTWTAGATGGSAITAYTVHKFSNGALIDSTNVGTSTSANLAVNTGVPYTFRVSAENANGMSELSASSNSITTSNSITADILVIAGGGAGGGYFYGAGGGAGGLVALTSQTLNSSTPYSVTVGNGGTYSGDTGSNGGNSQFGSLTAAVGGGRSANQYTSPGNGGSGGGANTTHNTPGTGTSGQGNSGGSVSGTGAGGGGGAGAVGGNGPAGAGGNGLSTYSSWGSATSTGENVSGTYWYAGGGGSQGTNHGLGGGGGGDRTGANNAAKYNGLANTGGGGGGAGDNNGYNGGSGVVILRTAGTYTATATTGSPTRVVNGGYTYYTWTGNGSITI